MATLNGNALGNKLIGTALDDLMFGFGGTDTLSGGAGNDWLDGGTGADSMAGGTGDDTYVVDNTFDRITEAAGAGTDLVLTGLGSYRLGANLEHLTFSGLVTSSFAGTGNDIANLIRSAGGDDTLNGGGGNDTLEAGAGDDDLRGGTGNDRLFAGEGDDMLDGGSGNDMLDAGGGHDHVVAGTGNDSVLAGGGDDTILSGDGADTVRGGAGNDLLGAIVDPFFNELDVFRHDANDFAADRLYGEDGNDTLLGHAGDTLSGGTGDDTYSIEAGVTVIEGRGDDGFDSIEFHGMAYTLGGGFERLSFEYEAFELGDVGAVGFGNTLDNIIVGGGYGDTLDGGDGGDTIAGGDDDDSLIGGLGDDRLGDPGDGEHGDDTLHGGAGADTLKGGQNEDELHGDEGDDLLSGGAHADILSGGDGNDTLEGGTHADLLHGGAGADVFRFNAGDAGFMKPDALHEPLGDRIADFVRGDDKIDLSPVMPGLIAGYVYDWENLPEHLTFSAEGPAAFSVWETELDALTRLVSLDMSGDAHVDFEIVVSCGGMTGWGAFDASDFIL